MIAFHPMEFISALSFFDLLWCLEIHLNIGWLWNKWLYGFGGLKMKIFTSIFGMLQVSFRDLVWGVWTHSRVCLNSNWGFNKIFLKEMSFPKRVLRKRGLIHAISQAQVSISQNTHTWNVIFWYDCEDFMLE